MFNRLLAILCLCLPLEALAQGKTTDFMLGNGMQVVVIEDHRAPVVVHMVWYKVGSADEPPGKSVGLARASTPLLHNTSTALRQLYAVSISSIYSMQTWVFYSNFRVQGVRSFASARILVSCTSTRPVLSFYSNLSL